MTHNLSAASPCGKPLVDGTKSTTPYIAPETLRQIMEPVDLYDALAESNRISGRQKVVTLFCLVMASWAVVYFAFELLRLAL